MNHGAAYQTIEEYSRRISDLEKIDFQLWWDSDIVMPPGGSPARSSQRSTAVDAQFRYRSDDTLGEALDSVSEERLDEREQAVVREMRREYNTSSRVPYELHKQIGEVSSRAHESWKQAKEAGDFDQFRPEVESIFELKREWANHVDPDTDPYEVLWTRRTGWYAQPSISMEVVDSIFSDLREHLPPLIQQVKDSDYQPATTLAEESFDIDEQVDLNLEILEMMGFDPDRVRFDLGPHPISIGSQYDVRMTSRMSDDSLIDGLTSSIHEFGHGIYTLGLPRSEYGSPLGEPRGPAIHESQSRFLENHIGRSKAFWEMALPKISDHFPAVENTSPQEAYEVANAVNKENLIRTKADELTYHMHIILRTEIERAILDGEISYDDIEDVWQDKCRAYLGLSPETDAEGPLQDPHWARGPPGFIMYTIGSVLAAQLNAAMAEDLGGLDDYVRRGEFDPIREWLTENIHKHGQRYRADELIRNATGEDLTATYFIEYIQTKYSELYNL